MNPHAHKELRLLRPARLPFRHPSMVKLGGCLGVEPKACVVSRVGPLARVREVDRMKAFAPVFPTGEEPFLIHPHRY